MLECHAMEFPPTPRSWIVAQEFLRSGDCGSERLPNQLVTFRSRFGSKTFFLRLGQLLEQQGYAAQIASFGSRVGRQAIGIEGCEQLLEPDGVQWSRLRVARKVAAEGSHNRRIRS